VLYTALLNGVWEVFFTPKHTARYTAEEENKNNILINMKKNKENINKKNNIQHKKICCIQHCMNLFVYQYTKFRSNEN